MIIEELPYSHYVSEGEAILKNYDEACEWLDDIGIPYKRTRFGKYKDSIDKFSKSIDGENDTEFKKNLYDFLNAYLEATDLIRVKNNLSNGNLNEYIDRLKKVASGSAFRKIGANDQSRDFTFELTIASRYVQGGYEVDLTNIADVIAIVNGKRVYTECKRIQSVKKIESNIKKANTQLLKRIKADKSTQSRGMVAININCVINPTNEMILTNSADDLQRLNSEQLNDFVIEHEKELCAKKSTKVLGVFTEYISQGFVHGIEHPAICNCRGVKLYQYDKNSSNESLLRELAKNLSNQNIK